LLGVITGLENLKKHTKVLVTSDSKYVVDSVEKGWVFNWEKKNFIGKKNPTYGKKFLEVYKA
jgi:ribonuclease HI